MLRVVHSSKFSGVSQVIEKFTPQQKCRNVLQRWKLTAEDKKDEIRPRIGCKFDLITWCMFYCTKLLPNIFLC